MAKKQSPEIKLEVKPPETKTLGERIKSNDDDIKKIIKDLYVSPRTCWSPILVRVAIDAHDIGQFRSSGILVDAMLKDPWIFSCCNTLVYGVIGLHEGWRWEDGYVPTKEDEARLEITNKWWECFLQSSVPATIVKWIANMGFSIVTKAWNLTETEDGEIYIPDCHVVHPSNVYLEVYSGKYYVITQTHGVVEIDKYDPRIQLIKHVDSERPFMQGAVRSLGMVWIDKITAQAAWRSFLDLFGNPLKVFTTDREYSTPPEGDVEDFKSMLASSLQWGTPIHLMKDETLDLLQADSNSGDAFDKKIAADNKEISLVYLGQNLTTDVSSGSMAAAKVHENVKADYIEAYAKMLNSALYQIVKEFYLFNFGEGVEVPMPFFNPAQPVDALNTAKVSSEKAKALKELGDAFSKMVGITYKGKPVMDMINIDSLLTELGANVLPDEN